VLDRLAFLSAAGPSFAQEIPASPDVKIAEAARHLSVAQLPEAERDLRKALTLHPSATEAHFLLGYVLFRERRPADSLAEYNAGARRRTPTADELLWIASDYILLKGLADAERSLLFATAYYPADPAFGTSSAARSRTRTTMRTLPTLFLARSSSVPATYVSSTTSASPSKDSGARPTLSGPTRPRSTGSPTSPNPIRSPASILAASSSAKANTPKR